MDSLYDRALSEVGQEGKFQIRFDIFYNVLLCALWSMAYNNIILALTITPHICQLPENPTNMSEYFWKLKYIPTVEDASGGTKFSDCLIYTRQENNRTEACSIYDYDKTWFEATVSSDNNWVCENELYVANIFAYSKIGETVGSFIFGWFGDVNLIESPQWLWVNREYKKCIRILKQIGNVNKTKLSTNVENEILTSAQDVVASKTEALGPLALFSGWRLAINTILQLLLWVCVSINYTVVLLSSAEKSSGNPFLDFAWQSLAEIPGFFIASWLADRIGRRYTGIISTALTTLIWIVYGFRDISSTEWLKSPWVGTSLVISNRFTISVSYYIINLLNMELYPTCLRQTGMSLGNVVSGGAGAIAPYILHLGRRFDVRYSNAILIITTMFGGVLTSFFLPETLNVKLPETLEDAQRFGRHNRTYYVSVNIKNDTVDSNLPVI